MLLAFVDESNYREFYGFASVVADEAATKSLTDRLNNVMRQAAVDYGVPATAEIHGYPLFHGTEDWKGVGTRARIQVFTKVVQEIAASDVVVLLRSVHEGRLRARQQRENYRVHFPAEQVAFQHILQRVDRQAELARDYALVIADERGDRERHRERFATYQTAGTPGVYMHTTLPRLLDTVHFAPSHHSRMLQAADVLAFTYRRRQTTPERDPRAQAVMEQIWQTLSQCGAIRDPGCWPA